MVGLKCSRCGLGLDRVIVPNEGEILCPSCGEKLGASLSISYEATQSHEPVSVPPVPSNFLDQTIGNPSGTSPPTQDPNNNARTMKAHAFAFLSPPTEPNTMGRLGDYRIIRVIGRGGMGVVFEAWDPHLDRSVAIKAMIPVGDDDPSSQDRFYREAQAMASVRSDHIVTIYQVGKVQQVPYLVMEYLQGEPLDARLRNKGAADVTETLRIGLEIALGLEAAHKSGLIHRDIKPSNIWLESPAGRVKILDFGLARTSKVASFVTQPGMVFGTPAYMAPEQAEGISIDAKCDVYSLGCVLYELITGQVPFRGETVLALLMAAKTQALIPPQKCNPLIPDALNRLILQLLAKKPADRLSATEVVEHLENIAFELGISARSSSRKLSASWQAPRRSRRKFLLAGLGLAGAAGAALWARQYFATPQESEIVLGMSGPFSGSSRELGRELKLGIEAYLSYVNDQGGINGRKIKLIALDDGYDPDRALENMKELHEQRKVFAVIGNVGTAQAMKTVPYANDNKVLFFGGYTGAQLLREDPPARYIFNYRASYKEETAAVVNYLLTKQRLRPEQLAVFAQNDAFGSDGFEGVANTLQRSGRDPKEIVRVGYERNMVDVKDAVRTILDHPEIRAVVMVATYKAASTFIRKIKDAKREMVFTNVSFVGTLALVDELMQAGPGYAEGVIITQVVPPVHSGATLVLKFRELLKQYSPNERPTYTSLEGYIDAVILLEGIKRSGKNPTTESVINALETIHDFDPGTGATIAFRPSDHQASHKVWGTVLTRDGDIQVLKLDD